MIVEDPIFCKFINSVYPVTHYDIEKLFPGDHYEARKARKKWQRFTVLEEAVEIPDGQLPLLAREE